MMVFIFCLFYCFTSLYPLRPGSLVSDPISFRSHIDGAVIVTTPAEVSLSDVRKEISFCKKVGLKVIGVIENMSTFICPTCSYHSEIFPVSEVDGVRKMATDMG